MAKEIYFDTNGREHIISKVLNSGKQGVVYKTEEPNVLLKLEWNSETKELNKDISNNAKFDKIKILPLLEKTNLILPQAILKDIVGYTMKMLDGMDSLKNVFDSDENELPNNEWIDSIKENNKETGEILQKYIATGGMRKRLNVFLNLSCVLAKIHASGLVYCDISGNNIFISSDPKKSNVWLIDCDNLDFMKNSIKKKDGGLHTPGYGAPEVYKDTGKTMYSDAFSFAIALFWELTTNHPFMGKAAEEKIGELDMLEIPEVDYACTGDLAWICDKEDNSNYSNSMPYDFFLCESLFDKFQKTFSETGRRKKQERTTMPEWSYVLAKELDHTIRCKHCCMDYNIEKGKKCPWCDTENSVLKVSVYKVFADKKKLKWDFVKEIVEEVINVPLRVLEGFCSNHLNEKAFKIIWTKEGIEIEDLSNQYNFFIGSNKEKQIYGNTKFIIKNKIILSAVDKRNSNNYLLEIEVKQ